MNTKNQIIELIVDEDNTILVDAIIIDDGKRRMIDATTESEVKRTGKKLETVVNNLTPLFNVISKNISSSMNDLIQKPSEMELELSVGFTSDCNLVLGKIGVESNVRIMLKWDFSNNKAT